MVGTTTLLSWIWVQELYTRALRGSVYSSSFMGKALLHHLKEAAMDVWTVWALCSMVSSIPHQEERRDFAGWCKSKIQWVHCTGGTTRLSVPLSPIAFLRQWLPKFYMHTESLGECIKKYTCWYSRSGVGPDGLHFSPALYCCWSLDYKALGHLGQRLAYFSHKGQTANTGFVGHGVSHSYSTLLL